jgi:hypothetical protein
MSRIQRTGVGGGVSSAEIEATRWKKLIPEVIEKLKKLVGEALEITGVRTLKGEGLSSLSTVVGFQKVQAFVLEPAGLSGQRGYLKVAAVAVEVGEGVHNDFNPEFAANFYSVSPPPAKTATFTGWTSPNLPVGVEQRGLLLMIYNNSVEGEGADVKLLSENGGSAVGNRFAFVGAELVLKARQSAVFIYLGGTWLLVAHT